MIGSGLTAAGLRSCSLFVLVVNVQFGASQTVRTMDEWSHPVQTSVIRFDFRARPFALTARSKKMPTRSHSCLY
jgi:hypothetical protein